MGTRPMRPINMLSLIHALERLTTYTSSISSPAIACMSELFPLPGTPCRRYPRRKGIPRSAYHFSLARKSLASPRSISFTPGSSTMLPMGRLCLASAQRHDPCGSARNICAR